MLRLVADENFSGSIIRGVRLRDPSIDLLRVQDTVMAGAADPDVLNWAAENDRILLTRDRRTMPGYAYERVAAGKKMPGVIVLSRKNPRWICVIMTTGSEDPPWATRV
jgi:hypothetical protein